ncbi:MAG: hypothetical protein L0154_09175 [Chloroflexi bacterium]|nr:hypothetical protein [Chloroflexota bacterium]
MSPEILLLIGAALLVLMFLFFRISPERINPCAGRTPHERAHISQILDKLEAILDKIEMDLHHNTIEDAVIEQRIDALLGLAERGLCEHYALWSVSIEHDIDRTDRDYQLADTRVWTLDEIEAILTRLEGIMAPLESAETT